MSVTFVKFEKQYPDYIAYTEDGRYARIHINSDNSITVYGISKKSVTLRGMYYSAFAGCPAMDALVKMANGSRGYWQEYYKYADTCMTLGLNPLAAALSFRWYENGLNSAQLLKATQRYPTDKAALLRELNNLWLQQTGLTQEEIDFWMTIGVHSRLTEYKDLYMSSKKFRNLILKVIASPVSRVIGESSVLLYICKYIEYLKVADMKIETGDFWVNYLKAQATAKAIKEATENATFNANQTKRNLIYENDTFIVIVPTTRKECIEEGKRLNNCLGGYEWENYLKNGKRQVVFIRRKTEPERAYIACDISSSGKISQFLTYNNTRVKEEDANNFKAEYQQYLTQLYKF